MSKTIAVIGAGPGVGRAVAERFGREGFNVALLARNAERLNELAGQLRGRGIESKVFVADVLDRPGLVAALEQAIAHFGAIDVLEYGPTPGPVTLRPPSAIDVENERYHLEFSVLGAIAAVRAVLPGLRERRDGALLFTTAASAQYPVTFTASFGVAAGASLNYARVLNQELAADGVYAGIVSIAGLVVPLGQDGGVSPGGFGFPPGLSLVSAEAVAQTHWDLYVKRDRVEAFVGDPEVIRKIAGL
jgi:NADP-dependent 3-hydroxy acid dehydrogenase YdfG